MREYATVSPSFWIGETGRKLRTMGSEVQVVAMYLITSPHANMLGLYYLPVAFISHETGISTEGATKGLARLSEGGFCSYDHISEVVWVHEMARFQVGKELKPGDNQIKGVATAYKDLPSNQFLRDFFDRYSTCFHMKEPRDFEGATKGLRSQEQEQEQEQEKRNGSSGDEYVLPADGKKLLPLLRSQKPEENQDPPKDDEVLAWIEDQYPLVHAEAEDQNKTIRSVAIRYFKAYLRGDRKWQGIAQRESNRKHAAEIQKRNSGPDTRPQVPMELLK